MKIKTALNIFKEILYIKKTFRRYSGMLARGKYYQYDCFRAIALDNAEVREQSSRYFGSKVFYRRMAEVARTMNKIGFLTNRNRRSTEEYQGMYLSNNYDKVREVKLFAFDRKKILTVCTSASEADKQIEEYTTLGYAYNMPRVEKNEKCENAYEISMVDTKDFDDADALKSICRSTVKYNQGKEVCRFETGTALTDFSYGEETNNYLEKILKKISPDLLSDSVPCCFQHGDLSKENLIYGQCDGREGFWWIDWEHSGERVFFYDYFFYIINSAFYDDLKPFESFIEGESDEALGDLFEHFGIEFDKTKKFDYFLIFAIVFLTERVCPKTGMPVLKKYYTLIESLEMRMTGEEN